MSTPQPFTAFRDASTPCRETLVWSTDVQLARDGTDNARSQRRAYPKHSYGFDVALLSDADKSALTALRTADTFLVPLWCHQIEDGESLPTAGVAASNPLIAQLNHLSEGVFIDAGDFVPSETLPLAMPAAVGRPTDDTRSMSYLKQTLQTASVSFRLVDFKEAVAPYTGPTSGGIPLLAPFLVGDGDLEEAIEVSANTFDNDHLDIYDLRYLKRSFSVNVTLLTRAQVVAFRQFLFALKGRLNPLRWAAPGESESTWRLASDSVDLSYILPGLVSCRLTLVQL